jgi:hypothetical protein
MQRIRRYDQTSGLLRPLPLNSWTLFTVIDRIDTVADDFKNPSATHNAQFKLASHNSFNSALRLHLKTFDPFELRTLLTPHWKS